MTTEQRLTAYSAAADDVIACMLITLKVSKPYYERARFVHKLEADDFPNLRYASLYARLQDMHDQGIPLHDTTILEVCEKSGVTIAWLAQLRALVGNPKDNRTEMGIFDENVRIVKEGGMARRAVATMQSLASDIDSGKYKTDAHLRYAIDVLSALAGNRGAQMRVKADEVAADFEASLETKCALFAATGLPWLDNLIGGYDPSRMMYIAGAYKSGKSRLMLNLAIQAALNKQSAAIYSVEMTAKDVAAAIVSMLAVGYLRATGHYTHQGTTPNHKVYYSNWISAQWLRRVGVDYKIAGSVRAEAITWAINQFRNVKDYLRIYTSEPERGGINSWSDLQLAITRDTEVHGGTLHYVDYLQLLHVDAIREQTDKNKLAVIAPGLQRMTQQREITIIPVVQLNEESIKHSTADSYTPGVSGGSDVPKTADYLITVNWGDKGNDDGTGSTVKFQMHKSRWSDSGAHTQTDNLQHRQSGVLLDMDWIQKLSTGGL